VAKFVVVVFGGRGSKSQFQKIHVCQKKKRTLRGEEKFSEENLAQVVPLKKEPEVCLKENTPRKGGGRMTLTSNGH